MSGNSRPIRRVGPRTCQSVFQEDMGEPALARTEAIEQGKCDDVIHSLAATALSIPRALRSSTSALMARDLQMGLHLAYGVGDGIDEAESPTATF